MERSTALRKALSSASKAGLVIPLLLLFMSSASRPAHAQGVLAGPTAYSSYAVGESNATYDWGKNLNGQLGDGTTNNAIIPLLLAYPTGVTQWIQAASGNGYILAIGNDGNLYAWGLNNHSQLGDGTTTQSLTPLIVAKPAGVTSWTAVAAGNGHSVALGDDGNVYTWGYDSWGQIGNGTHGTDQTTLYKVTLPGGLTAKAVAASDNATFAIASNDTIYSWGRNANGQLGNGTTTDSYSPDTVLMPAGVRPTHLSPGAYFCAFLGDDGNIYAMGQGNNGQIGNGTTSPGNITVPTMANKPAGVTGWNYVVCGASFTLALANNDSLYAWGYGGTGEMGNGTTTSNNTVAGAVSLPAGLSAKEISAGHNHGLATCSDGKVYAWGRNAEGQLGDSSTTNSSIPVVVHGVGTDQYLILASAPPAPVLVSPANQATGQQTSLTLKWNMVSNAAGYQCQVSTDPTFATSIVVNDSSLADTLDAVTGLGNSATYYWRVRSYTRIMLSGFSTVDTFSTIAAAPSMPALVAPANNAMDLPGTDTLVCTQASGAAQYHWQLSTDPAFSAYVVNDSTMDTMRVVSALSAGTKYYWQVRAVNPGGASAFAGPDSFTVMALPGVPVLASPANNATFQRADTLVLKWHKIADAVGYKLQLSTGLAFSSMTVEKDSISDTTYAVSKLANLQKYYWRVRSYNAGGPSAYCAADSFTTIVSVPAKPALSAPSLNATGVPRRATLEWNPSTLAERYRLQVATAFQVYTTGDSVGAFLQQNVVFDTTLTATSHQLSSALSATTKYYWHVSGADTAGWGLFSDPSIFTTGTGILGVDDLAGIPKVFALMQNYPNPFNPSTMIRYDVPKSEQVTIRVYDIMGRLVETLVDTRQAPGKYRVEFNASRFASGVYFVRMNAGTFSRMQKIMLVK